MKYESETLNLANEMLAKIKEIEYNLMYNKKTNYSIHDLMSLTHKFNDLFMPVKKPYNFNSTNNLF